MKESIMQDSARRAKSIQGACAAAQGFVSLEDALRILFDNHLERLEILTRLATPGGCRYCQHGFNLETEILFAQDRMGNVCIAHVADQYILHESGMTTISALGAWHIGSLTSGLRQANIHQLAEAVA